MPHIFVAAASLSFAATPAFAETPVSSDSIADSVGIDVHLHYTDTPYNNFLLVQRLLTDLKVRHIRDGVIDTKWDEFYKRHNALGKEGIRCVFVTSPKQSETLLATYPNRVRGDFEGYEGPNEYNSSGDPNWSETLKGYMPSLYRITKNSSAMGERAIVIGPSLTLPDAYPTTSGLQQYFDFANMHNYPGGRNPGTPGWGGGGYGSIEWNIALARKAWGGKPLVTTETGYTTDPENKQSVPEDVEGKYMPRLILEQILHHIQRTYIYELIDVGPKVSKNDAAFGLARNDGSKKPAYSALQSLIELTNDRGSSAELRDLGFTLSGDASNVHHLLAQRGDGTYLLFYWIEEPSFDPNSRKVEPVPTKSISFSSSSRFRSAEVVRISAQGSVTSQPVKHAGAIPLVAADTISVLKLTPAGRK